MDGISFLASLLSTQTPLLPAPLSARIYLVLAWALVLACAGLELMRRTPLARTGGWRWLLPAVLWLWALWPGPASPAYWLGLAFRAPSAVTALLCAWWLLQQLRPAAGPLEASRAWRGAEAAGIGLGWLLLLDTFAVLPFPLYAWGFSPLVLGVAALLAGGPWLLAAAPRPVPGVSWLLGGALLLHGLLRLPTGNLWDALLDPWLWGWLQLGLLRRGWRALRA